MEKEEDEEDEEEASRKDSEQILIRIEFKKWKKEE